jgi:hypothetical protein
MFVRRDSSTQWQLQLSKRRATERPSALNFTFSIRRYFKNINEVTQALEECS